MPVFMIKTRDVVYITYRVEADTEKNAIDKVLNFEDGVEEWDEYFDGAEVEEVYEEKKDE